MSILIDKQFIKDIKNSSSFIIRFAGVHSSLQIFDKSSNRNVTINFESPIKKAFRSDIYVSVYADLKTPLTTFINHLKDGDKLQFSANDYSSKALNEAGLYCWHLECDLTRYKRNSDVISKVEQWHIDSFIIGEA